MRRNPGDKKDRSLVRVGELGLFPGCRPKEAVKEPTPKQHRLQGIGKPQGLAAPTKSGVIVQGADRFSEASCLLQGEGPRQSTPESRHLAGLESAAQCPQTV